MTGKQGIMADTITEKAQELGRLIGQTDEFSALNRARQRLREDDELRELIETIESTERELTQALQQGQEPSEELRTRYEETASSLQGHPGYQSLVAAQSNLDKILKRVNEAIGQGMEKASSSRIILPS